jgi:hypothetical protein
MVDVFPPPAEELRNGLFSVIAGALASGTPEPSWVAVDDGTDAWVVEVSTRSAVERARGVVATRNEQALVTAQRLGIGGAMWLPPSSLGALEAFAASSAGGAPLAHDAAALELLGGSSALQVVAPADCNFWRAQLGDRELGQMFAELALSLETPAAVLQWPALVVADRDRAAIVKAWEELVAENRRAGPAVVLHPLEGIEGGVLDGAHAALIAGSAVGESSSPVAPQPVHELPHGRRVGWWGIGTSETSEDEGWRAAPVDVAPTRCRWRIDSFERSGFVEEVLTSDEIAGLEKVQAVRVPGWASRGLRPGGPAGLLVTRIAEAASRRGLPLWIPNVDHEGLRLVFGLPGVIWVDGPAVPR